MRIDENDIIDIIEGVVRRYNLISESKSRYESMARNTLREMFQQSPNFRDRMVTLMNYAIHNPAVNENPKLKRKLQELNNEYQSTNNIDILVYFWYDQFRSSIPYMQTKAVYFLPGCIKLFGKHELGDATSFSTIGRIANYLVSLPDRGGYNSYFSKNNDKEPESLNSIIRATSEGRSEASKRNKEELDNSDFESDKKYDVVLIRDYDQARRYGQYTNWCICHDEMNWDQYTNGGQCTVYFMLADGFEDTPRERGDNYPYDEYGESMICVIVFPDGDLAWSTCRWNEGETHGDISKRYKKCPDLLYTPKELSKILGDNFYYAFQPKSGPLNYNDDEYDDSDEDIANAY